MNRGKSGNGKKILTIVVGLVELDLPPVQFYTAVVYYRQVKNIKLAKITYDAGIPRYRPPPRRSLPQPDADEAGLWHLRPRCEYSVHVAVLPDVLYFPGISYGSYSQQRGVSTSRVPE